MASDALNTEACGVWDCYRRLVVRYGDTVDLMSSQGLRDLDQKRVDAMAYAAAVARWAPVGTIVDVGSGGGLPGVVLAAGMPERPLLWVERRRRRVAFLRLVAAACGLAHVRVVDRDVRSLERQELPAALAAVTAQAVAGFTTLYRLTRHLHDAEVVLVARRGEQWPEEVGSLAKAVAADVAVLAAEPLGRGGTLVVVSVAGGRTCR